MTGSPWPVVLAWGGAVGLGTAATVSFAAAEQGANRRIWTRVIGQLFAWVALAALLAVVGIAAGWLSVDVPERLRVDVASGIAVVAAVVLAICALLAMLRLNKIKRTRLLSGGALVTGLSGAFFASARVASNTAMFSLATTARVMPRCAKMSAILPIEITWPPAALTRSSSVSAWGGVVRSLRLVVRLNEAAVSPTKGRDMMGYCPNEWVSDYTYSALFERIASVSMTKDIAAKRVNPNASAAAAHYRIATVGASGELAWDGDLDLDEEFEARGDVRRLGRGEHGLRRRGVAGRHGDALAHRVGDHRRGDRVEDTDRDGESGRPQLERLAA